MNDFIARRNNDSFNYCEISTINNQILGELSL